MSTTFGPQFVTDEHSKHVQKLVEVCTLPNPAYHTAQRFSPYATRIDPHEFHWESESVNGTEVFRFPRCAWQGVLPPPKTAAPFDNTLKVLPVIALTEVQQEVLAAFRSRSAYYAGACDFFVAPTGVGKTMLQAEMARHYGGPVLVILTTSLIMRAWRSDLCKLYGLKSAHEIGLIQQDKVRVSPHFTLAMAATLTRRNKSWLRELLKQFRAVVIDESQVITRPIIRNVCNAFNGPVITASATPDADDHTKSLVRLYFGQPFYSIANTAGKNIGHALPLEEVRALSLPGVFDAEGTVFDYEGYLETLSLHEKRNQQVCAEILKSCKAGRMVLAVSPRRAHVTLLAHMLRAKGINPLVILGGISRADLDAKVNAVMGKKTKCVLATTQAVSIGANLNPVEELFLVIPPGKQSMLEQLVGRVRRTFDGKKSCRVTYCVDPAIGYSAGKWNDSQKLWKKLKVPKVIDYSRPGLLF